MLVGLTGPSGSFKTRVAKRLEKAHGFNRMHVADKLKDGFAEAHGLSKADMTKPGIERPNAKLGGASVRDTMEVTSDALHEIAPKATAMSIRKRAMPQLAKGKSVVFDGVRSPAEADQIRKMGGEIWRCDNGQKLDEKLPMNKRQAAVKEDKKIDTSGSKGDTRANVDTMMAKAIGAM